MSLADNSDGPRLLIYTGIGMVGTWISIHLIDYFQVKLVQIVTINQ